MATLQAAKCEISLKQRDFEMKLPKRSSIGSANSLWSREIYWMFSKNNNHIGKMVKTETRGHAHFKKSYVGKIVMVSNNFSGDK